MTLDIQPFDVADYLKTPEDVRHYLDAAFEDGDAEQIRYSLNAVARSKGMAQIAEKAGIKRGTLYKALGDGGNPTLDTLLRLMKALDLRLSVAA